VAGAAPGLDEVARLVEFEHRRRGHAFVALVFAHAGRALQDPGMALRVDRYARDLAPDPLAGQLWPRGIDLEARDLLLLCGRGRPRSALKREEHRRGNSGEETCGHVQPPFLLDDVVANLSHDFFLQEHGAPPLPAGEREPHRICGAACGSSIQKYALQFWSASYRAGGLVGGALEGVVDRE